MHPSCPRPGQAEHRALCTLAAAGGRPRAPSPARGPPLTYLPALPCRLQDFRRTLAAPGRIVDGLALQYAIPPLLALLLGRLLALPQHYALGCALPRPPAASGRTVCLRVPVA